jgi:hypothetical protein
VQPRQSGAALALVAAVVAVVVITVGCTTGSGSSFSLTVGADLERGSIERSSTDDEDDTGAGTGVAEGEPDAVVHELRIDSQPDDADVFLNGSFVGSTPLILTDLAAGRYHIELTKDGYHSAVDRVFYDGGIHQLSYTLDEITGFIDIAVEPAGARLEIDGDSLAPGRSEAPVGVHRIRARLFGYEERSMDVEIRENRVSSIALQLAVAPFRFANLRTPRTVLNPENPGLLGQARLSFWVSGPGSARLEVSPVGAEPVRTLPLAPFSTWEQSVVWDGRDEAGATVMAGLYRARLHGAGSRPGDGPGREPETATLELRVDYGSVIAYRSVWSGVSGTMLAASAEVLPAAVTQTTLQVLGHRGVDMNGDVRLRAPVSVAARFGLGGEWELSRSRLGAASPPSGGSSSEGRLVRQPSAWHPRCAWPWKSTL